MIFSMIVLGFAALYILQTIIFLMGLKSITDYDERWTPSVSIIIPVKDEEKNIEQSLQSLMKIDYPNDKLEIIIIDDYSTDQTTSIIQELIHKHPHMKLIRANYDVDSQYKGKQRVLSQAVSSSRGEIIMLTDADCHVQPEWVRSTVKLFGPQVGLVGGYTLHTWKGERASLLAHLQSMDMLYLLSIAAGGIGVGMPLSLLGTNLSYRRKAYDEIGGYDAIPFSLVEDMFLVKTIARQKKWKTRFAIDPLQVVFTQPMKTLKDFFQQRARWTASGFFTTWKERFWGYDWIVIGLGFITHILIILAIILNIQAGIILFAITGKVLADFCFLTLAEYRIRRKDLIKYFPLFEIFYFMYLLILPVIVLTRTRVYWKGRPYYSVR